MPRVARDAFVRFRFFGNQGVPVIVCPSTLYTQALGVFQGLQGFLAGQFFKLDFTGEVSQLGGALVLRENHPVRISGFIHDFHAASGHRGKEFRQEMQPGHRFPAFPAAKNFRR